MNKLLSGIFLKKESNVISAQNELINTLTETIRLLEDRAKQAEGLNNILAPAVRALLVRAENAEQTLYEIQVKQYNTNFPPQIESKREIH